jgi:hypothetical protein
MREAIRVLLLLFGVTLLSLSGVAVLAAVVAWVERARWGPGPLFAAPEALALAAAAAALAGTALLGFRRALRER